MTSSQPIPELQPISAFSPTIVLGASRSGEPVTLNMRMANRHGLIAGATGTGKTVTLQVLAEQFSRQGVPVFMADVKGDLSGLASPGTRKESIEGRLSRISFLNWNARACPVVLWDVFQKRGLPVRTTVSEVGPLLLSRLLNLNDTQSDILQIAFKIADDQKLLLLDIKDLKALLTWISENSSSLKGDYGNLASSSVATIQRSLVALEDSGAQLLFGEPALKISHLMQTDYSGNGVISILEASSLLHDGRTYSTLLLWLLSELFENLEEVGDQDKPKLVFFFDEAHLLFRDAPRSLVEKVEQVVKLIRSRGVSVFFVTQNPLDIPESVLGQLGNRVQHALRAFTPKDQKAVRAAAQTFRQNPNFSTEEAIQQLEVGEALVSVLDERGAPTMVERTLIAPPESHIGPLEEGARNEMIKRSPLASVYAESIDRESAFESLLKRASAASPSSETPRAITKPPSTRGRQGYFEAVSKSMLRSLGTTLGREIMRGIFGSMKR